jgi:hypothetical protein
VFFWVISQSVSQWVGVNLSAVRPGVLTEVLFSLQMLGCCLQTEEDCFFF